MIKESILEYILINGYQGIVAYENSLYYNGLAT